MWRRGWDSTDEASAVRAIALPASSPPDVLLKSRFSSCSSAAAPVRIPGPSVVKNPGGGGGIRTHVAARTAKSISSRPRYGHFGTPPRVREVL